jgi:peptide deformylase
MKLVDPNDSILTTKCELFDFKNPPIDPIELAQDLVKTMYDLNGIGLAANQVGLSYRVFAMRGAPQNFVCFNPKIVMPGTEEVLLEENSLTFPGLYVKVKRSQHIRVRFTMANGETRSDTFTGITARTFQHLMDHMDGEVFYNKANKYHRDQAFKKWKK